MSSGKGLGAAINSLLPEFPYLGPPEKVPETPAGDGFPSSRLLNYLGVPQGTFWCAHRNATEKKATTVCRLKILKHSIQKEQPSPKHKHKTAQKWSKNT